MKMNDREKCEAILDEMNSKLLDIKIQWDTRHYSPQLVLRKVGSLQESALNFKLFYRRYIDRCEKKSEFVEDIGEHLKND